MPPVACFVPGCGRPTYARGACRGHYARIVYAERHGTAPDLTTPLRDRAAPAREVVSLRVSPECRDRVRAKPAAARLVLEHWARSK